MGTLTKLESDRGSYTVECGKISSTIEIPTWLHLLLQMMPLHSYNRHFAG